MARFRFGFRMLSALTLVGGLQQAGYGQATKPEDILAYKPRQPGVEISTPTTAEIGACVLSVENGKALPNGKQPTAWVLKDGQGRVLRKFHDTTGLGGVNMFAYYRDGEECYREVDSNGNKAVDQYRWLGPNGSKWGVDANEDGKIDSWNVISPEELSQEILAAVVAKDSRRLEALVISRAELTALGLPAAETSRIQAKIAGLAEQFAKTTKELAALPPQTIWVHLETKLPQTVPADSLGASADLVRYRHATILYQEGDGKDAKHNWLQTGEMIQVGKAWRIIQAPTAGMHGPDTGAVATDEGAAIPPGAENLLKQLTELDQKGPTKPGREGIIEFNMARSRTLEQIAALFSKAEDRAKRDTWLKQVADCLAAAAQQGDKAALDRLSQWHGAIAKDSAAPTVGYFLFRVISAQYAQELPKVDSSKPDALNKFQEAWKAKLTKFINDYPKSEDTPDAILQLGMVNEFFGAKMEDEARAAYALLAKNFPSHVLAKRAQGCLDRLTLEGKEIDLSGPTLAGGAAFDVRTLKNKAVVVYYWASWNDLAQSDFNKIKLAMKDFAGRAEFVGVNLDVKSPDAGAFLRANPIEGAQLHLPGGLDSPFAVRYGITALPVMFLVGPDGKVVNRTVQASTLDDELKKLFKVAEKDK